MALFLLVVTCLILRHVQSICTNTQPEHLLCVNEFRFENIYTDIKTLTLVDSFIAHYKLRSAFPHVETIEVKGRMVQEECNVLRNTEYNVVGCGSRKYNLYKCIYFSLFENE